MDELKCVMLYKLTYTHSPPSWDNSGDRTNEHFFRTQDEMHAFKQEYPKGIATNVLAFVHENTYYPLGNPVSFQ